MGKFSKTYQEFIQELNTITLLRAIRDRGPISRSELARETGLSPSTVTNLTRVLLQRSLISETEHGVSRGGRKPVLLQFNHRGGVLLGAEIAYEKLSEMPDPAVRWKMLNNKQAYLEGDQG